MKKGTKKLVKVLHKIFAFANPVFIIFIAMMMIGKALPAWTALVIVTVGWIALVLGILGIVFAFMDLFK